MKSCRLTHALSFALCLFILDQGLYAVEKFVLPKPSGPYAVGRASFHLVDASRTDEQGSREDHKREFMMLVWYPSEPGAKGSPAEWLPSAWVSLEAGGLLGTMLGRSSDPSAKDISGVLRSVSVHALERSPIAKSRRCLFLPASSARARKCESSSTMAQHPQLPTPASCVCSSGPT